MSISLVLLGESLEYSLSSNFMNSSGWMNRIDKHEVVDFFGAAVIKVGCRTVVSAIDWAGIWLNQHGEDVDVITRVFLVSES